MATVRRSPLRGRRAGREEEARLGIETKRSESKGEGTRVEPGKAANWGSAGEQMASGSAIACLDKKSLGMEGAKKMRREVFSCGDNNPDIATPKG